MIPLLSAYFLLIRIAMCQFLLTYSTLLLRWPQGKTGIIKVKHHILSTVLSGLLPRTEERVDKIVDIFRTNLVWKKECLWAREVTPLKRDNPPLDYVWRPHSPSQTLTIEALLYCWMTYLRLWFFLKSSRFWASKQGLSEPGVFGTRD